jgi:uncharacterized protein DUF4252
MSRTQIFAAIALTAALASTARAQGYFEFGQIPGISGEPTVQIELGAGLLAFVLAAATQADPAAADALKGIEGIRVRVYETIENEQAVLDFIDDTSGRLESAGWERAVFVQEGTDKVRIYAKLEQQKMTGLTLMVYDGEAVFINVAGALDPAQLGKLVGAFDVNGVNGILGGTARDNDSN